MWQKAKNVYHLGQAVTAHVANGFPARGVSFIGVTGTDGKTTTSSMIYHILRKSGKKTALVSTVAAIIDGESYDTGSHVTNPDLSALLKYIKLAVKARSEYIVLEVTSHGLDQYRVFGIQFKIGVITNITHEHLDYHKTYDNYVSAKFRLLQHSQIAIINRDDQSYEILEQKIRTEQLNKWLRVMTYGMKNNADINPEKFPFETHLLGDFNKYNSLAAISVCQQLGIDSDKIRDALTDFSAPVGREEIVYNKDFAVMIDFAHTPNAIEQILSAVKNDINDKGRIIHVFGAAGLRDNSKRPLMGQSSCKYADIIILTSEDPRTEKVEEINNQIKKGFAKDKINGNNLFEITNRQQAIDKAIAIARGGDMVVVTGKGHENSMNFGHGEVYWDDHQAVKYALEKRKNAAKN